MRLRDKLIVPLTFAITLMWLAAGAEALYRNDIKVLGVVSIPFGLVTGYVFGVNLPRVREQR